MFVVDVTTYPFSHVGKATFFNCFCPHATYINGTNELGTLADVELYHDNFKKGFI